MTRYYTREFLFEESDTCKQNWIFDLRRENEETYIESVQILENTKPIGCVGHPKTLMALLKGRTLKSLDIDALSETACSKNESCGKILAKCLTKLTTE